MKVKELIQLLMDVNCEADVLVDVNEGSIFPLHLAASEGQMELSDPTKWAEVVLVAGHFGK
jgi:hypothetical protein